MQIVLRSFLLALTATLLCSCATSSVEKTWTSPEHKSGALKSVATVAVDDRTDVRKVFEGQFATQLEKRGLKAQRTHELMGLDEIKADRKAAAKRLFDSGIEHALAIRLLDTVTYAREYSETGSRYTSVATGFYTDAWGTYCELAFSDMGVTRGSMKNVHYLETSVFDLKSGHLVWRGISKTTLKEDANRLDEIRPLVAKVLAGMQKDGLLR